MLLSLRAVELTTLGSCLVHDSPHDTSSEIALNIISSVRQFRDFANRVRQEPISPNIE